MSETFNDEIESVASVLKDIAQDMKVDVFLSLVECSEAVSRYLETELAKEDVSPTRFRAATRLIIHGGAMLQKDIAKEVHRSKQTVTQVIDGLEKEGTAKRVPAGKDRRIRNKVVLTRNGLERLNQTMPARRRISHEATSCLSQQEAEQLNITLKKLTNHLLGHTANSRKQGR